MAQKKAPGPPPLPEVRERAEWFRRLDPDAQKLVRARWAEEEGEREGVVLQTLARLRRGVIEGASVFVAAELALALSGGLAPPSLLAALALGACVGLGWTVFDAGMTFSLLTATPAYFLLLTFFSSSLGDLLVGPLLVALPSAYLGWRRSVGPMG